MINQDTCLLSGNESISYDTFNEGLLEDEEQRRNRAILSEHISENVANNNLWLKKSVKDINIKRWILVFLLISAFAVDYMDAKYAINHSTDDII